MIDDGEVRCGACETALPVKDDVFLCRACMDKLPGNLRHDVLSVEEQYQYGARKRALEALGVDRGGKFSEQDRINLKPRREPRQAECRCEKPFLMKTDGLFGGTEDVCGNCCRPIVRARRVLA